MVLLLLLKCLLSSDVEFVEEKKREQLCCGFLYRVGGYSRVLVDLLRGTHMGTQRVQGANELT